MTCFHCKEPIAFSSTSFMYRYSFTIRVGWNRPIRIRLVYEKWKGFCRVVRGSGYVTVMNCAKSSFAKRLLCFLGLHRWEWPDMCIGWAECDRPGCGAIGRHGRVIGWKLYVENWREDSAEELRRDVAMWRGIAVAFALGMIVLLIVMRYL